MKNHTHIASKEVLTWECSSQLGAIFHLDIAAFGARLFVEIS
jgi:hypothetical protein